MEASNEFEILILLCDGTNGPMNRSGSTERYGVVVLYCTPVVLCLRSHCDVTVNFWVLEFGNFLARP
jgi:hypothetical protein